MAPSLYWGSTMLVSVSGSIDLSPRRCRRAFHRCLAFAGLYGSVMARCNRTLVPVVVGLILGKAILCHVLQYGRVRQHHSHFRHGFAAPREASRPFPALVSSRTTHLCN